MATTRFYLDLRGRAKDGKGSVLITIYHNGTTSTIPTGVRLAPNEWDGSHVVRTRDASLINARLTKLMSEINTKIALYSIEESFSRQSATQIKNRIVGKSVVRTGKDLVSEIFADYMAKPMKDGTRAIYNATLRKVLAFGGAGLKIENIDLKWLHRFDSFLAKSQGVNGRAIYLRSLRAICNYAKHINIISDYPFEDFQIKHEETRKRSIPIEQLRAFRDCKIPANIEVYRDYFFLMLYLIGINSIDLFLAKKDAIINGRFEYIRRKTNKKYSIKIEPEAQTLLDKYSGKDWLVDVMDHCKSYKNFTHEMNNALKQIGDVRWEMIQNEKDPYSTPALKKTVVPSIEGISTYFSRHTWATLAYECGIPIEVIAQALGHSYGNRTTLIYIRHDQSKIDDANRMVIDYINNNLLEPGGKDISQSVHSP